MDIATTSVAPHPFKARDWWRPWDCKHCVMHEYHHPVMAAQNRWVERRPLDASWERRQARRRALKHPIRRWQSIRRHRDYLPPRVRQALPPFDIMTPEEWVTWKQELT